MLTRRCSPRFSWIAKCVYCLDMFYHIGRVSQKGPRHKDNHVIMDIFQMFCTMRSPSQMCVDRTSPSRRKKRNGNVIWHVSGEAKPAHEAPKLWPKRYCTASMYGETGRRLPWQVIQVH